MCGHPKKETKLSDLLQKTTPLSQALHHSIHLKPGEVAALYLPNILEFHPIVFSAWLCGAIISAADPDLSLKVLTIQLEEIKPKVIFCTHGNKVRIEEALSAAGLENKPVLVVLAPKSNEHTDVITLEKLYKEGSSLPSLPTHINEGFNPADVILILWSSGK